MRIEATRENLHGVFDPELPPVATVQSGQEVSFETLEVGWRTGRVVADGSASKLEPRYAELDDGPALTGPVAVAGARPGQLLEIEILKVTPGLWGWNSAPGYLCKELNAALEVHDKASVFWDIDHEGGVAVNQFGHRVPLAPFPGSLGIAPGQGRVDGWTPRALTGGNLDLKLLTEGARLFLPVQAAGALVSVGDGHAAQGDGEVGGTAIECPMQEVRLRFAVHDLPPHGLPWVERPGLLATFAVGSTLDQAMPKALAAMLEVMGHRYRLARNQALALASTCVDLRITQVVNPLVGVHAVLDTRPLETGD